MVNACKQLRQKCFLSRFNVWSYINVLKLWSEQNLQNLKKHMFILLLSNFFRSKKIFFFFFFVSQHKGILRFLSFPASKTLAFFKSLSMLKIFFISGTQSYKRTRNCVILNLLKFFFKVLPNLGQSYRDGK